MQINSPSVGQIWPAEQFASSPSLTMAISPLMSAPFSAMPISNPQPTKYNYASQPSLWPNVVSWMNLVYEKIAGSIIWDFLEGCFKGANSLGKKASPCLIFCFSSSCTYEGHQQSSWGFEELQARREVQKERLLGAMMPRSHYPVTVWANRKIFAWEKNTLILLELPCVVVLVQEHNLIWILWQHRKHSANIWSVKGKPPVLGEHPRGNKFCWVGGES